MNMKHKKEILKDVFANNFSNFFNLEPSFIYLFFTLLKKLKDPKVLNITVLKNFRLNYHLFFENVNLAKFMIMLFDENFSERIQKERVFQKTVYTEQIFSIQEFQDEQFKENLAFVQKEMLSSNLLQNQLKMDQIENRIKINSTFSLLYYSIIKQLCKEDSEETLKEVLIEIFNKVANEVKENNQEGFTTSPSGQRLVKAIIQNISCCSAKNRILIEKCVKELIELIQ